MNTGNPHRVLCVLVALLVSLAPVLLTCSQAAAEDRYWGDNGVKVSGNGHQKRNHQVYGFDDGSAAVAWEDFDGTTWRVMAQLLDPDGHPLWGPNGKRVCDFNSGQYNPQIGLTDIGAITFLWLDDRSGPRRIFYQLIDLNGNPVTSDGSPLCVSGTNTQSQVNLASDFLDGYLNVTWQDNNGGSLETWAQRLDDEGNRLWGGNGVKVSQGGSGSVIAPQITTHGVVAWQNDTAGTFDTVVQKIGPTGAKEWGTGIKLNQGSTGTLSSPRVAEDADGTTYVAWQTKSGSDYNVRAQKIDPGGARLWDAGGVKVNGNALGDWPAPRVVADGTGGALAAFCKSDVAGLFPSFNRIGQNGARVFDLDRSFSDVHTIGWVDLQAVPPEDGIGSRFFQVTFEGERGTGSGGFKSRAAGTAVWSQQVDLEGRAQWGASGIMLSDIADDQENPVVRPDGQGGTVAAFSTTGGAVEGEVYAQRLAREGGAATWYLAEGCTGGGMETWVLVQNPGTKAVTCDLVLQTSSGEQRPPGLQDQQIPAGSRRSFNLGSYLTDWDISTKVEATGNVICERAMYGNGRSWAHDSIGSR